MLILSYSNKAVMRLDYQITEIAPYTCWLDLTLYQHLKRH